MALPEGVLTLHGRIDTFLVAHHLTKRRASSVKKRTPATVSWPHSSPLPDQLARAGFFYRPSSESNDNCMCFVCHRQLDGWEDGDDPVEEHIKHAPDCGWAINAIINKRTNEGTFVNEDPMSEKLADSRTATFAENWPYEGKKGWKCKVVKMVAAGWCYDPSPEYDDGVTCMYCSLSLDGWEPKDDPFVEHHKRSPDCEFFRLLDEWAVARKQAKGRKGRASRGGSKVSRLSTQSNATAVSEAPSLQSLGDDEPAEDDDSILTTATSTSTTGKGRKKAVPKSKGKAIRAKKVSKLDNSLIGIDHPEHIEKVPEVEEPKRRTARKASRAVSSQTEVTIIPAEPKKTARTKSTKGKAKQRVSDDESQLMSELQAAIDSSIMVQEEPAKPKRGTKRTSDGQAKIDSSIVMLSEAPSDIQAQQDKPKRGRKPKKQPTIDPEPRTSDVSTTPQRVSSVPTEGAPKSKEGKKVAKAVEPTPESEVDPGPEVQYPTLETEDDQMHDFARSIAAPINPYQEDVPEKTEYFTTPIANPYEPEQHTPEAPTGDPSPAPSTPTPARHSSVRRLANTPTPARHSNVMIIRSETPARPVSPIASKGADPTPSPQSSDAENHPPSSRPSARPLPPLPLSARRVPLADTTPDHVNLSPSKRNILNNISSAIPWSPTDLENVFLNSPVKKNLALNTVVLSDWDKENQTALDAVDLDKLDKKALEDVVRRVKKGMTDAEKKMSVEQWVRWNATRGEQRLKGECEAMVTKFESEGGRALRVLEGVCCVE